MCGRFALDWIPDLLLEVLGLSAPVTEARYNIAPGQECPVALQEPGREPGFQAMRWGLLPTWAPEGGKGLFNARSESAAEKPAFREAFRRRRCLVPASGFYEWRGKTPWYFYPASPEPGMVFAGLWEERRDGSRSFAILTRAADEVMSPVHDRMPLLLPPESWREWIDPGAPFLRIAELAALCNGGRLLRREVGDYVNRVGHEGERCLEPPEPSLFS